MTLPGAPISLPPWIEAKHAPPVWIAAERAWSLSRHADAAAILKNPAIEVADAHAEIDRLSRRSGHDYRNLSTLLSGILSFRNPPFHIKARNFLKKGLGLLDLSEQAIGDVVTPLVADARATGHIEAMGALCNQIPVQVISRALGLSEMAARQALVSGQQISESWLRALPLRTLDQLEDKSEQIVETMIEAIGEARGSGQGGLSRLIALNDDTYGFDDRELSAIVFFLLLAGIETSASFLGSTLFMLATDAAAIRRALEGSGNMKACLDECLRMAGPLRRVSARVAPQGLELGGIEFEPGALLIAEIEQAHYDPDAYGNPGRFDPGRFMPGSAGPPVLSFSAGQHACLGAVLARQEGALLVRALFSRSRCFLAKDCPDWDEHAFFRRLRTLELNIEPLTGDAG